MWRLRSVEPLRRRLPPGLAEIRRPPRGRDQPGTEKASWHQDAHDRDPGARARPPIPTTPRVRTIIDLARVEDERTVKRALRQARFTEAELALLPRTGPLGRIVGLSAAPTASGNEDFVLDLVLEAGFVHPLVNAPYRLPGQTYYPDLWWPEQRLIVEVDSREHHEAPLDQRDDLERQAWLEAKGERVLRTTKPQVERNPARFLARLDAAGAPYTSSAQTQL